MSETLKNGNAKRGRPLLYGVESQRFVLRVPPRLAERMAYEVNLRNMRDRSTTKWTVSRLVVDELARLYGIEGIDLDGGVS